MTERKKERKKAVVKGEKEKEKCAVTGEGKLKVNV